jgi:hypothetical protein
MPIFNDDDAASFQAAGSGFKFSGVNVKNLLGASAYTLVGLVADVSSSVHDFAAEIEGCIVNSLKGCQDSPQVDNLLVRFTTFASRVTEQHGYRLLADCHLANYKGVIKPGGTTALYDAATDMAGSLTTYGKTLTDDEYTVNGIIVILTDGEDVGSTFKAHHVKEQINAARRSESLESLTVILIGVNVTDPRISQFLQAFKDEAGIDQYVEAKDASPKTFSRIAGFISKSVSSTSQSVGSGGPSQPITF